MGRIAFFGSVYRGHNIAPRQLVEALSKRGYSVTYFHPKKYWDIVAEMDAFSVHYPEVQDGAFSNLMDLQLPSGLDVDSRIELLTRSTVAAAIELLSWVEGQLAEGDFDLVLYDNMAVWAYVVAQNIGLPSACSLTVMATNTGIMKELGEGAIYLGLPDSASKALRLLDAEGAELSSFVDVMTCEYNRQKILYTSKYFQNHPRFFPEEEYIFFPGRCKNEVSSKKDKALGAPTVFVSFGTIYNDNPQLFIDVIEGLLSFGCQIIASTGGNHDTYAALREYNEYSNISIDIFVNQEHALETSDIFVTHAGLNSASESICYRVPMIAIPLVGDQHGVANSLSKLNAGIRIEQEGAKKLIQEAIKSIMDNWDSYQEGLFQIRASFGDSHALQVSVNRLEALIGGEHHLHNE